MPLPAAPWLPAEVEASSWAAIEPYYADLLAREPSDAAALEELVLHKGELDSAVAHAWSLHTIASTCRTHDAAAKRGFDEFHAHVLPAARRAGAALDRKIVASPHAGDLDAARYRVYLRDLRAAVELHREENVALEAAERSIAQEFNAISGAQSVALGGETLTLAQAAARLDDPDAARRREAWVAAVERRAADREAIDDVLDRLVALRHRIARNAGFDDYRAYKFVARRRFDYAPADGEALHASIATVVVPLLSEEFARRAAALGQATVRPWDLHVHPGATAALRPFADAADLVARTARLLTRLDPELAREFERLRDGTSLDLESRPGKAPGGYQVDRDRDRRPFVFMNAAGRETDVRTLLHECGHAFHARACREDPLFHYRAPCAEIGETCAMSMELLAHPYLDEFYAGEDLTRARRGHLLTVAQVFPHVGMIDGFQGWMYTDPRHGRAEREVVWRELQRRFQPYVDWSGHEHVAGIDWQRVPHLFTHPFYMVEYGIAQLGALQLWRRARVDEAAALAGFRRGMRLGGSRTLPALFRAMGLRLDFGGETMRELIGALRAELAGLRG